MSFCLILQCGHFIRLSLFLTPLFRHRFRSFQFRIWRIHWISKPLTGDFLLKQRADSHAMPTGKDMSLIANPSFPVLSFPNLFLLNYFFFKSTLSSLNGSMCTRVCYFIYLFVILIYFLKIGAILFHSIPLYLQVKDNHYF
jgi:hypothetical protein